MRRVGTNAALLVAGLVGALVLCEGMLRLVDFTARLERPSNQMWPWIVYDPVLVRKNAPHFVSDALGIRINARGFRGDELPGEKPPRTIRIVCLGDSTTFGVWREGAYKIRAAASYPGELASLLRARGFEHVEVINAGVPGHTSGEGLAQLLLEVLPLAPDVVTLRYGNNDHVLLAGAEPPPASNETEYATLRRLPRWVMTSELGRLAFHVCRRLQRRVHHGPRLSPEQLEANVRHMLDLLAAHDVHVVILDFPYRAPDRGPSPGESFPNTFTEARSLAELHEIHERYQAVIRRLATETATPVVVTADALLASPTPPFTEWDLSHPNEAGARIIAERLFEALQAHGWLGTPDAPQSNAGAQNVVPASVTGRARAAVAASRRGPSRSGAWGPREPGLSGGEGWGRITSVP